MGFMSFICGCQMKLLPDAHFIICLLSAKPTANLDVVRTELSLAFSLCVFWRKNTRGFGNLTRKERMFSFRIVTRSSLGF